MIFKDKNRKNLTVLLALSAIAIIFSACSRNGELLPPKAKKIAYYQTLNDDKRVDYYAWFRDKSNHEVIDYIKEENSYTDVLMKSTASLQEKLISEFSSRNTMEEFNLNSGKYNYFNRFSEGNQYPVYFRKQRSPEGQEEIILDQNKLASGHSYYNIATFEVSRDQRYLAFSVDTSGAEAYTIYIKDLEKNILLPDIITNASAEFKWANDNSTLYYSRLDNRHRVDKIYRHRAGSSQGKDEFIYFEKDESFELHLLKTSSGRFILIGAANNSATEIYLIDANDTQARPRLFYPRQRKLQYFIDDNGAGRFLILSNDNAKNYKVDEVPAERISKRDWKTIVPHRNDIKIDEMFTFRNHLVLFEREKGKTRIEIVNLKSKASRLIRFEEPVYAIRFERNSEFKSKMLKVVYSSFITPPTVLSFNLDTGEKVQSVIKREVPGYNPSLYTTEKIFAKAKDGKDIPIVIVYKKGMSRNGENPMLLTGYGAYNIQNEPGFAPEIISLIDRGIIYGIAQIRGGGEIDDKWYEEGKLLNKKNTFSDFISCAEFLINSKYTSSEKLAINGRSAGGLLIGSIINMRPDLFKAAVPEMPFVDVVNTMLDPAIYGTIEDYAEYGNPKFKIYYDYMKSYSPYDNVKKQKYPDLLIIGSMNDKRVPYWQPLKWTARLREMKTGESMLLLKLYDNASHKGASGVYENYKMHALKYAFILDRLGIQS